LAGSGGDDDDEGVGVEPGAVKGDRGREGALAPLAGAVEQDSGRSGLDDFDWLGVGVEVEVLSEEVEGGEGLRVWLGGGSCCCGGGGWWWWGALVFALLPGGCCSGAGFFRAL
jgi:hypothetical protein